MKGITTENSHVVFCPNKPRYFEPFMRLDVCVSYADYLTETHIVCETCASKFLILAGEHSFTSIPLVEAGIHFRSLSYDYMLYDQLL